ncbi:response regulator [Bradyrhizobium lablabi]|uniref:response regulator transcription factor n=1 Tax=Bradyrhizobium lablabi TaxID=722472 RepID=UPI001BAD42DB|nr:response regulator [Bradyrhizobium lablabi]MBR1119941.1 response regulator [Bradyrhizobium lablabi]
MAKTPVIAIVDDDEGVRTSLASLIRSLGYEARTYGSGTDFLERPGEDPACMIADIQMPVMTGDELQAKLVASGRRFPIIFMTAFPTETVRQRVMSAGAHCYLNKPAGGDEIIRRLEEALAGHTPG